MSNDSANAKATDCSDLFNVTLPLCYAQESNGVRFWPPSDLFVRRAIFDVQQKLWDGRHTEVFRGIDGDPLNVGTGASDRWASSLFLSFNLLKKACIEKANVRFKAAPTVTVAKDFGDTQRALNRIIRDSKFHQVMYSAARSTLPAKGAMAVKVLMDPKDSSARIVSVPLEHCRFEFDSTNWMRLVKSEVGLVVPDSRDGQEAGAMVLRREIHSAGRIEYSAWELKLEDKQHSIYRVGAQVDLAAAFAKGEEVPAEVIETNVTRPVLRLIANIVEDGNPYGASEFDIVSIQIQRALMCSINDWVKNVREKQHGGILVLDESQRSNTSRGLMVVEGGVANLWGIVNSDKLGRPTVDRDKFKTVFENAHTRDSTRYVSVESSHEASLKLIEQQARMLAFQQDISIGQLFGEAGMSGISGVVLKMRMLPTTTAVEAGNVWLVPQIQELLYDTQVYEMWHRASHEVPAAPTKGWPDVYEPQLPSVILNSGLFEPESERVDAVQSRTSGEDATMSVVEAIQKLNHCSLEEAETTFNRILDEKMRIAMQRAEVDARGLGALVPGMRAPADAAGPGDRRRDAEGDAPVTDEETRQGNLDGEPPEDFSTGSTTA